MKKTRPLPFLLILAAILLVMSLPRVLSEKGRGAFAAFLSPLWEQADKIKRKSEEIIDKGTGASEEVLRLQAENHRQQRELRHLHEIVKHELYLTRSGAERSGEWLQVLEAYTDALPARVIFRNPSSWNSSCWINAGKESNKRIGKEVIAKNSPVVVGYSLVGVIDYVGDRQSRVRLLTDPGVTPAVRAVRGKPKRRMLAAQLNLMMDALMEEDNLFGSPDHKMELIEKLEGIEGKLLEDPSSLYLAKGVLTGSSRPAWRSQGLMLKGTGFNCDFPDALSPARDLRTGAPAGNHQQQNALSILKEKDLLVTTGMDGVFPPGLHVAEVTRIFPLKEGDFYYELEARPIAGNMDDLSLVYILPPIGYDPNEQPPLVGWE